MSDGYDDEGAKHYKDNSKGEIPKVPKTDQELNAADVIAYRQSIAPVGEPTLEVAAPAVESVVPELVELPAGFPPDGELVEPEPLPAPEPPAEPPF